MKALTSLDYHRWILGILTAAFVGGMFLLVTLSVNLARDVRDVAPLREEVASLQSSVATQSNDLAELAKAINALAASSAAADAALQNQVDAVADSVDAVAVALNASQALLLDLIEQQTTGP